MNTTNTPLGDEGLTQQARAILNGHCEYMDGLDRGQVTIRTQNALAAVKEALLASRNTASVPVGIEKVAAFLRSEQIDESLSPQHGEHFPSWSSGYLAAIDHAARFVASLSAPDHPPVEQPSIPEGMVGTLPRDRQAACRYFGYDDEKSLQYWGNASNHRDVERLAEAFAQHRQAYTPRPKPSEQPSRIDTLAARMGCVFVPHAKKVEQPSIPALVHSAILDSFEHIETLAPSIPEGMEPSVEAIAQFLHDEGGFDDAWSNRTWPEHRDDTGQRDGGFVKIVPSDVQAKFRDVARRLLTVFNTPRPKPSEQPAVRLEISEEDVEQLFWKWWHGDRPEGGGPAAGFHAGYRAALTAALGKGDRT